MADAHPKAQILGTDLSPTWHDDAIRPNLSLEVDDCCSNWTYIDEGRNLFDLIHIRCLYGSIKDWEKLYQQAFDHLNPGTGYIEQAELSLIPHFYYTADTAKPGLDHLEKDDEDLSDPDAVFLGWYNFWQECSEKTEKTWLVADNMARLIYDIGFENVREVRYMLPLFESSASTSAENLNLVVGGGYPDYPISRLIDIKKWFGQFWETGMEGWVLAISTRYMGVCLLPLPAI
jgi:Methyltransferase domain